MFELRFLLRYNNSFHVSRVVMFL